MNLPPVILGAPDWYGTVAATRDLGRRGVPVYLIGADRHAQSISSRFAAGRVDAPDPREPERFFQFLLEYGRKHPGHVLLRASDDVAFIHSHWREELATAFRLHIPSADVLQNLLDKKHLQRHASSVGLRTPDTSFPADDVEARRIGETARFPLLLKQRAQALSRTSWKGTPVYRAEDLAPAWRTFTARNTFAPLLGECWPGADRPMLQEYLPKESTRILCLSGFIAPSGSFATRASLKVLSHPRLLGIGLCFEHRPVLPDLEAAMITLCRRVGYTGLFQCELIERGDDLLLIDLNLRFYNFMSFDTARGLPQAWLQYLLATGRESELEEELARARQAVDAEGWVWCNHAALITQLSIERMRGYADRGEIARWRAWRSRARRVIDPVWQSDDWGPGMNDLRKRVLHLARHPRDTIRKNATGPGSVWPQSGAGSRADKAMYRSDASAH